MRLLFKPRPAWRYYKEGQLLFQFDVDLEDGTRCPQRVGKTLPRKLSGLDLTSSSEKPIHQCGRDHALEEKSRTLLRALGAAKLAREIRVEWNPRLQTAAGRADFREKLISLNPRLRDLNDRAARTELSADKLDCLKQSSLTQPGSSNPLSFDHSHPSPSNGTKLSDCWSGWLGGENCLNRECDAYESFRRSASGPSGRMR